MTKKLVWLPLLIVLTIGLLLAGCSSKTEETAKPAGETNQPAQDTAQAKPEEKVIELKFNDWGPPNIPIGKLHEQAAKMIEEKTNGRVKITNFFSQSLLPYPDTFKGVATGLADISLFAVGSNPGIHSLNNIFNLPMVGLPGLEKTSKIYNEMLAKYPELHQENEKLGVKWLTLRAMPPNQLHLVKGQARAPKDLKGKKIIASGSFTNIVNAAGGAAVTLGPPEWYEALGKGLAEGHIVHWAAVDGFKTYEVLKSHTHIGEGGLGMSGIGFIANLKTWNSLPPDIQQVIIDTYKWVNEESVKVDVGTIKTAVENNKAAGQTFIDTTPQEQQLWADAAKPIQDKWITETEAKGWPAKKIYDGLLELIKQSK